MENTNKARLSVGLVALLLLSGGAILGGSYRVTAQTGTATPAATEICATQSAVTTAESTHDGLDTPEPTEAVDADKVAQQCGDQNAQDNNDTTDSENNVEGTQAASDKAGDHVDQQGDHQDVGDSQPTPTPSAK